MRLRPEAYSFDGARDPNPTAFHAAPACRLCERGIGDTAVYCPLSLPGKSDGWDLANRRRGILRRGWDTAAARVLTKSWPLPRSTYVPRSFARWRGSTCAPS